MTSKLVNRTSQERQNICIHTNIYNKKKKKKKWMAMQHFDLTAISWRVVNE